MTNMKIKKDVINWICSLHFYVEARNPSVIAFGNEAFGRELGNLRINALIRRDTEELSLSLSPFITWGFSKMVATCKPRRGLLSVSNYVCTLILGLLTFIMVRNKCLLFKSSSPYCFAIIAKADLHKGEKGKKEQEKQSS